ncbi:hypothetical protein EZS27_017128 [termite gut metagenome]|uniref:DUF4369 domain-containing protein n=1 Tax=termite gut metagenome TaxID=433724 RepID=A0A5J4RLP3_9ZZZZ
MNKLFSVLFLLQFLTSCDHKYKIEGISSVNGLDGKTIFIKSYQNDDWKLLHSTEVVHGKFSIEGKADSVLMAALFVGNENIMPIVLEKGNIKISITKAQISAKGTVLNDALYDFFSRRDAIDMQIEELEYKESQMLFRGDDLDDIYTQLSREYKQLTKELDNCVKGFISDNYENVLGLNVFLMLCATQPYPMMTPQMENILKDAPQSFKSHPTIKEFISKTKENLLNLHNSRQTEQTKLAETQ